MTTDRIVQELDRGAIAILNAGNITVQVEHLDQGVLVDLKDEAGDVIDGTWLTFDEAKRD